MVSRFSPSVWCGVELQGMTMDRVSKVTSLVRATNSASHYPPLFLYALYDSADDELCIGADAVKDARRVLELRLRATRYPRPCATAEKSRAPGAFILTNPTRGRTPKGSPRDRPRPHFISEQKLDRAIIQGPRRQAYGDCNHCATEMCGREVWTGRISRRRDCDVLSIAESRVIMRGGTFEPYARD
jgi:hypothetical protein